MRSRSSLALTPSSARTSTSSTTPSLPSTCWAVGRSNPARVAPSRLSVSPKPMMPTRVKVRLPSWSTTSTESPSWNPAFFAVRASSAISSGTGRRAALAGRWRRPRAGGRRDARAERRGATGLDRVAVLVQDEREAEDRPLRDCHARDLAHRRRRCSRRAGGPVRRWWRCRPRRRLRTSPRRRCRRSGRRRARRRPSPWCRRARTCPTRR